MRRVERVRHRIREVAAHLLDHGGLRPLHALRECRRCNVRKDARVHFPDVAYRVGH